MEKAKAPYRVLVTDDDDGVRNALARFLAKAGYDVVQAEGGEAALDILAHGNFAAMLCDIRMPGMTGVELLPKVVAQDADLAVIMLTAVGDPGSAIQCLKLGATDYLIKPVELEELAHALQYALRKRELEIERREMERWLASEVAEKTKELSEQARQVELLSLSILMALVDAVDPPGTGGRNHSMRVANLSAHVAAEMGQGPEAIESVRIAARLHDLGRVAARDARLSGTQDRNAPTSESAPAVAARVLEPLRRHAEVTRIIFSQEARFDEARGASVPLGSRIVAVTNRFDELTEGPGGMSAADAMSVIRAQGGTEFDPAVVAALDAVIGRRTASSPARS
jgi:putative two-component system response regulator